MKRFIAFLLIASITFVFASCEIGGDLEAPETSEINGQGYKVFTSLSELSEYAVERNGLSTENLPEKNFAAFEYCVLPKKELEGAVFKEFRVVENNYITAEYSVDTELSKTFKDTIKDSYNIGRSSSAVYKVVLVPDEYQEGRLETWFRNGFAILTGEQYEDREYPIYYYAEYSTEDSETKILIGHSVIYYLPGMEIYIHLPAIAPIEDMIQYVDIDLVPLTE